MISLATSIAAGPATFSTVERSSPSSRASKTIGSWSTSAGSNPGVILAVLLSGTAVVEEYVVKLNGAAILDEGASLAGVGALDGSIFLITHRRRRAVRS